MDLNLYNTMKLPGPTSYIRFNNQQLFVIGDKNIKSKLLYSPSFGQRLNHFGLFYTMSNCVDVGHTSM